MTTTDVIAHTSDESIPKDLVRRKSNPLVRKEFLILASVLMFGLVVVHEGSHILASLLVGWDFTGCYATPSFPFLKIFWPNAPTSEANPFSWFIVMPLGKSFIERMAQNTKVKFFGQLNR